MDDHRITFDHTFSSANGVGQECSYRAPRGAQPCVPSTLENRGGHTTNWMK